MLKFDELKRISSVYVWMMVLVVSVVRKLLGCIELLFFPVVRANRVFREGILSLVRMGTVPTGEEIQILKRGISEQYSISPCQMAGAYSVLMDIYTETLCSKKCSATEKKTVRDYIITHGKKYRVRIIKNSAETLVYQGSLRLFISHDPRLTPFLPQDHSRCCQ